MSLPMIAFWVQIVVYALTTGVIYGSFRTRLNYIEAKMDKYNNHAERLIYAEQSTKSAHHRLDEVCERMTRDEKAVV